MPGLAPLKTRRPSAHLRCPETAAELEYVSVGCNRSVHGADWNHEDAPGGGLVAYGAHMAVAVYDPTGARVLRTLPGHDAPVTVVRWIPDSHAPGRWLVSGDADGVVILWHRTDDPSHPPAAGSVADGDIRVGDGRAGRRLDPESHRWRAVAKRKAHDGPVLDARAEHTFAQGEPNSVRLLVTASQDCLVRLWRLDIDLAPAPAPASATTDVAADGEAAPARAPLAARGALRFPLKRLPLSAALARLPGTDRLVLAVGGADGGVRLFLCDTSEITSDSDEDDDARGGDERAIKGVADALGSEGASEVAADAPGTGVVVEACATLAGHADWVRDLAFTADDAPSRAEGGGYPGLLLASGSQDRTARVWRVRVASASAADDGTTGDEGTRVPAFARLARPPPPPSAALGGAARVSAVLEALLQGHEDWVMSVAWRPAAAGLESDGVALLTASADRSLIHWTPAEAPRGGAAAVQSESTRVWMASQSVGDAASSCLGFYGAMFDASARRVLAHAHGGALHAWRRAGPGAASDARWAPAPASAGHAGDVTCLSWDAAGRFLLSGSADLTARAHAAWESRADEDDPRDPRDAPTAGWCEIARPQIHGHALTCVAALPPPGARPSAGRAEAKLAAGGSTTFVSGADEKTLRVFDAPGTFLGTLARSLPLADRAGRAALEAARARASDASGGAELPQLGLSNKALRAPEAAATPGPDASSVRLETSRRSARRGDSDGSAESVAELMAAQQGGAGANGDGTSADTFGSVTPAVLSRPPAEEALASATLWPEARKLYGHGDDVSCVAAHPDGVLVASACEARSESASAIWVWDASKDWRPLGKLAGATRTVVALHFASPAPASRGATPAGAAGSPGSFGAGAGDGSSASASSPPERSALLAASRDRHISIYVPSLTSVADGTGEGAWGSGWTLATRVKAHAKALYDAKWAPVGRHVFATAGRDKRAKVWRADRGSTATADESIAPFSCAATAVSFAPRRLGGKLILAVGLEDGGVRLLAGDPRLKPTRAPCGAGAPGGSGGPGPGSGPNWTVMCSVGARDAHTGAVRALAWRPWLANGPDSRAVDDADGDAASAAEAESRSGSPAVSVSGVSLGDPEDRDDEADGPMTLASCGADHAVRLFTVRRTGGSGAPKPTPSPQGRLAKEDSTSGPGAFFGSARARRDARDGE